MVLIPDLYMQVSVCCCSHEAESAIKDNLSEFSASLLAAYDSGDLVTALEEGRDGWQKWVKGFGKSLNRKVS